MKAFLSASVILIAATGAVTFFELRDLRSTFGIALLNEDIASDQDVKTVTWVDADCFTRTVTTKRRAGESDDEFCARHDRAVARDMQVYGTKDGKPSKWLQWWLKYNPKHILSNTPFL